MRVDPRWRVRGWALKKLDEEGEEERKRKETGEAKTGLTLGEVWHSSARCPWGRPDSGGDRSWTTTAP